MNPISLQRLRRGALAGLLAGGLAAVLAACGGGGGGASGTNFAQGAITGLGSIIVNGVRYDDSQAEHRRRRGRQPQARANCVWA